MGNRIFSTKQLFSHYYFYSYYILAAAVKGAGIG
jgi:hypothetical protein